MDKSSNQYTDIKPPPKGPVISRGYGPVSSFQNQPVISRGYGPIANAKGYGSVPDESVNRGPPQKANSYAGMPTGDNAKKAMGISGSPAAAAVDQQEPITQTYVTERPLPVRQSVAVGAGQGAAMYGQLQLSPSDDIGTAGAPLNASNLARLDASGGDHPPSPSHQSPSMELPTMAVHRTLASLAVAEGGGGGGGDISSSRGSMTGGGSSFGSRDSFSSSSGAGGAGTGTGTMDGAAARHHFYGPSPRTSQSAAADDCGGSATAPPDRQSTVIPGYVNVRQGKPLLTGGATNNHNQSTGDGDVASRGVGGERPQQPRQSTVIPGYVGGVRQGNPVLGPVTGAYSTGAISSVPLSSSSSSPSLPSSPSSSPLSASASSLPRVPAMDRPAVVGRAHASPSPPHHPHHTHNHQQPAAAAARRRMTTQGPPHQKQGPRRPPGAQQTAGGSGSGVHHHHRDRAETSPATSTHQHQQLDHHHHHHHRDRHQQYDHHNHHHGDRHQSPKPGPQQGPRNAALARRTTPPPTPSPAAAGQDRDLTRSEPAAPKTMDWPEVVHTVAPSRNRRLTEPPTNQHQQPTMQEGGGRPGNGPGQQLQQQQQQRLARRDTAQGLPTDWRGPEDAMAAASRPVPVAGLVAAAGSGGGSGGAKSAALSSSSSPLPLNRSSISSGRHHQQHQQASAAAAASALPMARRAATAAAAAAAASTQSIPGTAALESLLMQPQPQQQQQQQQGVGCPVCGKRYPTQHDLDQHFMLRHQIAAPRCPVCQRDRNLDPRGLPKCRDCGKIYPQGSDLAVHREKRHNVPFVCSSCGEN